MTRTIWRQAHRDLAIAAALLTALANPAAAQRGPAPSMTGLPADVLAMACSPKITFELPDRSLRVTGGQDTIRRRTWAPGDLITINAGTDNGIEVGQEYYIRRVQVENTNKVSRTTPASIRTAGWLRVYAVEKEMSLATVVHACDSIEVDDYLEPFVMPTVPTPAADGVKPQRGNYGRIMFGADRRRSFGKGDFFIINRGSDHGVALGDRFVVYRDKQVDQNFLYHVGEAVVMSVTPETATLQATVTRDAFLSGDYVSPRKRPSETQ
jgi:hypothetical protein